jgi:hypothetical protein
MPARWVILAERGAANDNFFDGNRPSDRWQFGTWFEACRNVLRMLTTASFSLLLLLLISAVFLLALGLVGLFAVGLAVVRLLWRHIPVPALPIYQIDRRAPG